MIEGVRNVRYIELGYDRDVVVDVGPPVVTQKIQNPRFSIAAAITSGDPLFPVDLTELGAVAYVRGLRVWLLEASVAAQALPADQIQFGFQTINVLTGAAALLPDVLYFNDVARNVPAPGPGTVAIAQTDLLLPAAIALQPNTIVFPVPLVPAASATPSAQLWVSLITSP